MRTRQAIGSYSIFRWKSRGESKEIRFRPDQRKDAKIAAQRMFFMRLLTKAERDMFWDFIDANTWEPQ
jgi:hypothetical protein